VRLEHLVIGMDEDGVDLRATDGTTTRLEARTKVWAAGMTASPFGAILAEATGAETDKIGRILVAPDCSVPGYADIFVVGDLMALDDLPGMAEVAMQSGRHAARLIARRAAGEAGATKRFRYIDLGMLATISRFRAVARFGPIQVGGTIGWVLWLTVHLTFLTGFKNRLSALAHWTVSFAGRGRAERAVTAHQVAERRRADSPRQTESSEPAA
jgi:NADH:ubiquinone reductase (H+-translocating)